jgi:hypothetical protein
MHARIDRQNRRFWRSTATPTNWKIHPEGYNRRNDAGNCLNRSALASKMILVTIRWKICPLMLWISSHGGLRTSWALWMHPNDSTNGIGCYMTQNVHPGKCGTGSEGFPHICSDAPSITPTVLPQELRPGWLNVAL